MNVKSVNYQNTRPDLNKTTLLVILSIVILAFLFSIALVVGKPGTPLLQLSAVIGSSLLLVPLCFSLIKRSGISKSPPFWFTLHIICSGVGAIFIFFHVANGYWITPPGMVLFAMMFLIVQGILARAYVSQRISYVFARSSMSFNFGSTLLIDQKQLQQIIDKKITLLEKIDSSASEALFSPALKHWLKFPIKSFFYQRLVAKEAHIVGARQRAGLLLRWWRRIHLLMAVIFFFGLIAHIVVVLFFAGYAAGNDEIYWWYIFDWGRS